MTPRSETPRSRADFHAASGVLLVVREPPPPAPPAAGQPPTVGANPAEGREVLLAVWDDGSVTALHGHVDLGTGIATALAQLVAEELDLAVDDVHMVLGSTALAPNQGATIASASIQVHAAPLRAAAAQAAGWLRANPPGVEGLKGRHVELLLAPATPLKPEAEHRVVGRSQPRVDIPAKLRGELVFVHDMRVPGMLHGRVVRPPYAGADHGEFIGNTLEAVDEASIAHIPGVRNIVVIRDFVGVVAEREEQAEQAARELRVAWKPWPGLPDVADIEQALRNNPSTSRRLVDEGDVDAALAALAEPMPRTYVWPYQLHASIGPSCALADVQADGSGTVWAGTQNPHVLRADLAKLLGVDETRIAVERMEAAGCYGRNGADDVAADAALLSRAAGAPVRVQLTREQENAWEPKGAAQLMQVNGGLGADGGVAAWDFRSAYPSNGAPTLALLLTRTSEPLARAYEMGDRTARPPYAAPNLRVTVDDMPPLLRASWLRGVSALPNSFAHESYIDELAHAAGADPVAFRLRHLHDERATELVQATAARAGWLAHTQPQQQPAEGDFLRGQGFAYARYMHSKWPGFGAAWAAWVADVEVNRVTGEVHVRRVVVGHDAGLVVNPAGVEHQVHGNVIQATSRALKEKLDVDAPGEGGQGGIRSLEWGSYPILNFREVPVIDVLQMPRPGAPPLGAGESASVPGTAAIANAIFDATGVRFRSPPFTPEVVRAAMNPLPGPAAASASATTSAASTAATPSADVLPPDAPWPKRRPLLARAAALLLGGAGVVAGLLGWRPAIAPVAVVDASIYTPATLERGRVLAAIGNCAGCHTAPGGERNAGGLAMETPFGTIFTTNITPDADTGIGRWSFSAFQRAMRHGIAADGRHLYPAFPYTAFAKTSDGDLQALYAHLMAQPAVRAEPPASALRFPFNLRPLLAGWNALFLDATPFAAEPQRSAEWMRGAYLVEGLGHCGGCHTPRNALGAEQGGRAHFAGALVDGWVAPPLTALSPSPLPWTAQSLFDYLRHGHSAEHGTAGGPMAPVVRELAAVPDADLRAMAAYLASFQNPAPAAGTAQAAHTAQAARIVAAAAAQAPLPDASQRLFQGACGSCHHDGDGPALIGTNTPLALSTQLHGALPNNLIRTILDGVREPAGPQLGFMPAFRHAVNDTQIAELAAYMRRRFAPGQPPWAGLREAVAEARRSAGMAHGHE